MNTVHLDLPEIEARELFRRLHQDPADQETFCETYRQLQSFFFRTMTVEQITALLENTE